MAKELSLADRKMEKDIAEVVGELESAQLEEFNPCLDGKIRLSIDALNKYAVIAKEEVLKHIDEIKECLRGIAKFYENNQASMPMLSRIYQTP